MIAGFLQIVAAAASWLFGLWKKKNDPSLSQRDDAIDAAYEKKREDLERR